MKLSDLDKVYDLAGEREGFVRLISEATRSHLKKARTGSYSANDGDDAGDAEMVPADEISVGSVGVPDDILMEVAVAVRTLVRDVALAKIAEIDVGLAALGVIVDLPTVAEEMEKEAAE